MTDAERCLYLRAMLEGTPADGDEALRQARGTAVTLHELLALDELGLLELVRGNVAGSSGSQGAEDPVVEVLGLTGSGHSFAENCSQTE